MTVPGTPCLAAALAASLLAIGPFAAAAAPAAPKAEVRAQALQRLSDCRKLTDGIARLACFDREAAALDQAEAKGDIVVVDRDQARKVRRQAFGFTLPSLAMFERGEKPAALENLTTTVERAYQQGAGAWVLELEGGAVWVQTDQERLSRDPKKGSKAEIRKAALGTFFLNLDGQRAIRAKRVE